VYLDWRLLGMTRGFRGRIVLAALIGLAAVPVSMLRLTLTGTTMARAFTGEPFEALLGALGLIALLILLRAVLQLARDELANATAALMKARVRGLLYEQILRLGAGHFDQRRSGDAALALVDGVEQLDPFFGQYLPQLIVAALTPVIIFAFMAFLDLATAVIFLVFALLTLVTPAAFHKLNSNASLGFRRAQGNTAAEFLDSIQGLATLKAFGQSRQRGFQLAARARYLYRSTMWVLAINIGTGGVTLLGISAGAAVALGWGAVRVQAGELPLATLLVVLLLGVEVFRPLRDMVQLFHSSMLAVAATRGMYALLDAEPEVQPPSNPVIPSSALRPVLRFEQVTFGYQGGRRPAVFDVSFGLEPGQSLGVVGASGAGKSTLVNLLLRFVDPQQGRILLDGHDLRDLPLELLRSQIAVVAQDTYLFYGTVADNLRVARPDAALAELEAACQAANAHGFISELPGGYETVIGERGVRLSGGQRQRLAIARALLKDAPILVLDEALSSVDAENEATIQQALDRLQRGRTTLVIAHRLSSVANADQIVVLDRGRLVEEGPPDELMARPNGIYRTLMAAQRTDVSAEEAPVGNGVSPDGAVPGSSAAAPDSECNGHAQSANGALAVPGAPEVEHATPSVSPAHSHGSSYSFSAGGHAHSHGAGPPASVAAATGANLPASQIWRRLLLLVRPWWQETALVFLLGPLQAGAQVALGVVSALLVAQVVNGGNLTPWLWGLGLLVPIAAVLRWTDSWISHDLAYRLLAELRIRLYELLDPLAPAYLVRRRSGDLVSALLGDVELIELFYAHTISPLFVAIVVPGGILLALGVLAPWLAVVLVPFLASVALTPLLAARQSAALGSALREVTGEVTAHAIDSVQGLRTIAAFDHGQTRAAEVALRSRQLGELKRSFLRWQAVQNAVIEALMGLGALAVMTAGVVLVTDGQLVRTALPLVTLLAAASFQPVVTIVTVAKELHQTVGAAQRFFAVEDEPVPVQDGPLHLTLPPPADQAEAAPSPGSEVAARPPAAPDGAALSHTADLTVTSPASAANSTDGHGMLLTDAAARHVGLRFEALTFAYSHAERPALHDVSFDIPAGHTVALVGRSGAGKTTAAHLLLRFWDPQQGRIVIGDHDVRDLALDDLRGLIALVAQDTYLFNTTLRDNIRLGRPEASIGEVHAAGRAANVDEFAQALPEGYDTYVGERGLQLSGGQRQRVSIARALLKNAPILVLDEATSHLDAVSEAEVRQALDRLSQGRTTLVIAHRLSTIRQADQIVVLDSGSIVEQGTHAELLAQDGLYSHLIATQLGPTAAAAPPSTASHVV
jgi:ATP-binding cassette subfamily C protein CydCD